MGRGRNQVLQIVPGRLIERRNLHVAFVELIAFEQAFGIGQKRIRG